ncbi:MAG: hypothetical protein HQL22_12560, partial [Candidatus Omnitrophica bacterium]|nr:hypothetical protein [Candidatus Omnitrophota bacterium]
PDVLDDPSTIAKAVLRDIVIPQLEQEVNTGTNFAPLRQVYYSLILALWFKRHMKDSILGRKYVDQNKIQGIERINQPQPLPTGGHVTPEGGSVSPSRLPTPQPMNPKAPQVSTPSPTTTDDLSPELIYQQYLQAFKQGVYNYIKEETDPLTNEVIPRKYFSGGVSVPKDFAERNIDYASNIESTEAVVANAGLIAIDLGIGKNKDSYPSANAAAGTQAIDPMKGLDVNSGLRSANLPSGHNVLMLGKSANVNIDTDAVVQAIMPEIRRRSFDRFGVYHTGFQLSQELPANELVSQFKKTGSIAVFGKKYEEKCELLRNEMSSASISIPGVIDWSSQGYQFYPSEKINSSIQIKTDFIYKQHISDRYEANIGWKFHLNVSPEDVSVVAKYLIQNGYYHKYLNGGDLSTGETFTVYIGSFSKAMELAQILSRDLQKYLKMPENENELEFASGVAGRFHVAAYKDLTRYGWWGGLPVFHDDQHELISLYRSGTLDQKEIEKAYINSLMDLYPGYGAYLFDPGSLVGSMSVNRNRSLTDSIPFRVSLQRNTTVRVKIKYDNRAWGYLFDITMDSKGVVSVQGKTDGWWKEDTINFTLSTERIVVSWKTAFLGDLTFRDVDLFGKRLNPIVEIENPLNLPIKATIVSWRLEASPAQSADYAAKTSPTDNASKVEDLVRDRFFNNTDVRMNVSDFDDLNFSHTQHPPLDSPKIFNTIKSLLLNDAIRRAFINLRIEYSKQKLLGKPVLTYYWLSKNDEDRLVYIDLLRKAVHQAVPEMGDFDNGATGYTARHDEQKVAIMGRIDFQEYGYSSNQAWKIPLLVNPTKIKEVNEYLRKEGYLFKWGGAAVEKGIGGSSIGFQFDLYVGSWRKVNEVSRMLVSDLSPWLINALEYKGVYGRMTSLGLSSCILLPSGLKARFVDIAVNSDSVNGMPFRGQYWEKYKNDSLGYAVMNFEVTQNKFGDYFYPSLDAKTGGERLAKIKGVTENLLLRGTETQGYHYSYASNPWDQRMIQSWLNNKYIKEEVDAEIRSVPLLRDLQNLDFNKVSQWSGQIKLKFLKLLKKVIIRQPSMIYFETGGVSWQVSRIKVKHDYDVLSHPKAYWELHLPVHLLYASKVLAYLKNNGFGIDFDRMRGPIPVDMERGIFHIKVKIGSWKKANEVAQEFAEVLKPWLVNVENEHHVLIKNKRRSVGMGIFGSFVDEDNKEKSSLFLDRGNRANVEEAVGFFLDQYRNYFWSADMAQGVSEQAQSADHAAITQEQEDWALR